MQSLHVMVKSPAYRGFSFWWAGNNLVITLPGMFDTGQSG